MSTIPAAVDWDRLAVEFSLAYDASHDIIAGLKRAFHVASYARGRISSPAAEVILETVASEHGVTLDQLIFGRKVRKIVDARDDAWSRLWDEGKGMAYLAIGKRFGMDHTSVIAGVRRHRARVGSRGLEAVKAAA